MNYKVYPRIAAMAEVGWTSSDRKVYKRFLAALLNGYLKSQLGKQGYYTFNRAVVWRK
jgi:hypothetical protein